MFKKAILGALAMSTVGALAVGCSAEADFGADQDAAASALGSEQRGCPSLVVRRQMLQGGTTTASVSGVQASIVNNGAKVRCGTNATGAFTVGVSERATLYSPDPSVRITRRGNDLVFNPPLPPQASWQGPAAGRIESLSCIYKGSTLEGTGFPSVSLPLTTVWEYRRDPDPRKNDLHVTCTVTTPNPLALTTDRPRDILATSGDDFVFRCDMTASARRSACQNVCNGNSQCLASCDTNAGCSPIFCEGSECPGQPSCAPQNRCSATSDCGSPGRLQCIQGCCATIIR